MSGLPDFRSRNGLAQALLGGSSGAVIWEGPSALGGAPLVVVASGMVPRGAANGKTGRVIQTWILRRDVSPIAAVSSGKDSSICGDCKLRSGSGRRRACYVHLGMVGNLWNCFTEGFYPKLPDLSFARAALFAGRVTRLGSYGDPAFVPDAVWEPAFDHGKGWVGYTHQWRVRPDLRRFVMASVDSLEFIRRGEGPRDALLPGQPGGRALRNPEERNPVSGRSRSREADDLREVSTLRRLEALGR